MQIDPWPAGSFGDAAEDATRLTRVVSYLRHDPTDNGYAHPIEGLVAVIDLSARRVVEIVDHGVVPVPAECSNYDIERAGPARTTLRPLEIVQPDGPSFTVDGNLLSWENWRLRVSMDPIEGLVLHQVGWDDGTRVRPILHRAALSEMVVPYGTTAPTHDWKNAFDAGEWGMGRFVNSLALGCDCLGEIVYLDAVMATERGGASTVSQAICLHEEDFGILWKHQDLHSGTTEVRRNRRFVISSIYTVGNYEYAFYWYLYLDGTIELEVKLTGIMQTMAVAEGSPPAQSVMIAPELAAPLHQHLFNVRLDVCIDGPDNSVYEVDVEAMPAGPDNPRNNAMTTVETLLGTEQAAQRLIDPTRSRTWRIVNPSVTNRLGRPVAYKLLPGAWPTLLAGEDAAGAAACRLRHPPPLGHALRRGRVPGRRALRQPEHRRRRAPRVDRDGPTRGRHRRGRVVHLRRHPRAPPRGLAGHAGRAHRLQPRPRGVLRSQPGPRPPAERRPLPHVTTAGPTVTPGGRARARTPAGRPASSRGRSRSRACATTAGTARGPAPRC